MHTKHISHNPQPDLFCTCAETHTMSDQCIPYVSPEERRKAVVQAILAHVGSFVMLQLAITFLKNMANKKTTPLAFIGVVSVKDTTGAIMQILDSEQHLEALLQKFPELRKCTNLPKYLRGSAGLKGLRACTIIVHDDGGSGGNVYVFTQHIQIDKALAEATVDQRFTEHVPALTRLAHYVSRKRAQHGSRVHQK